MFKQIVFTLLCFAIVVHSSTWCVCEKKTFINEKSNKIASTCHNLSNNWRTIAYACCWDPSYNDGVTASEGIGLEKLKAACNDDTWELYCEDKNTHCIS